MRRFFHFSQNNSGGEFARDDNVDHHVVVEASTAEEASHRAEQLGIYYDGCDSGRDCSCCGDRWYPAYGDGDQQPEVYGAPVLNLSAERQPEKNFIVVFYADGTKRYGNQASRWSDKDLALSSPFTGSKRAVPKIKRQTKAEADAKMWAEVAKAEKLIAKKGR